jgi:T6SS immunity protein Tdi1, C-terminal
MALPEIPAGYILPAVRPDWEKLLVDWQPLLPPQRSLWLLTKFGEVFFCHQDGKIGMLQVSGFQYKVVAKDKTDFQERLVDPLEAIGRHLQPEQCYSFITPLALGGGLTIENVMVIPIWEHFGCWGDVFRQLKDVPDGGQVVLKVVPGPKAD